MHDTRPTGGSITWARVQRELGRRFALARRPDARHDCVVLGRHTAERLAAVRDVLADGLHLPRDSAHAELRAKADDEPFVYLTGPSGCGKTALAKAWITEAPSRVWLTPRDLADGLVELGLRLRLRLPLPDVLALGEAPVRVVVDGLDRGDDETAHAATAALAKLAAESAGSLQVLVTSQSFAFDRVAQRIQHAGAPAAATVTIGDLDDDDIQLALGQRPELHRLAYQGKLQEVLRRPKLLEVVFQALGTADDATLRAVRDEAAVAELWWDRLALGASPARAARGELLRGLAEWTAEQYADALPAGRLHDAGLAAYVDAVEPLRGEEILAAGDDAYGFGHDLYADWVRLTTLGTWPAARAAIRERQTRPPWHRAIRLFALRALRDGGVSRWAEQHAALREAGDEHAADLYLDAPVFAAEAEQYLRDLWPVLVEGQNRLLARMLTRFRLVGSVTDPRAALVTDGGPHPFQLAMATTWRLPTWVLWPPVLRALAADPAAAVAAAPLPVIALAELWLQVAPPGYAGRAEAAALAFATGEFAARAEHPGQRFDEKDKERLWTGFLAAAAERPDDVSVFVLDALRNTRRAIDRRTVDGEASSDIGGATGALPDDREALRDTESAAGWRGVDREALRAVVLSAHALVPMLRRHPQAAATLVLAAILRDPAEPESFSLRADLGISDRFGRGEPLPETGPMIALFTHAPEVATPTLLEIVRHATAVWAAHATPPEEDAAAFEIVLDGEWVRLNGDAGVMHWHRGSPMVLSALVSALMGLEQYLYRRLDRQIETGLPLEELLAELLRSGSLAILGVLVEVACYRSQLLSGPLAPLVTSAGLIVADQIYKGGDHGYLGASFSEHERRSLRLWHDRPHRSVTLAQVAMELALKGEGPIAELAAARPRWASAPDGRWRFLVAQLDPSNYERGEREAGDTDWVFCPPEEVRRVLDAARDEDELRRWWLETPGELKKAIEEGELATDEEAEAFWSALQEELAEPPSDEQLEDSALRRAAVECGVAATLLVCAPAWVFARPEVEAFCREAVLRPFAEPPRTIRFDFPEADVSSRWDGFVAIALPILWARDAGDEALRGAAARLATSEHFQAVRRFFAALQDHPRLAEDAGRLETLSLHWARFRCWRDERALREQRAAGGPPGAPRPEDLPDLEPAMHATVDAFVAGTLDSRPPKLRAFVAATPEAMLPTKGSAQRRPAAPSRPQHRLAHTIDMPYLAAARAHLLTLTGHPGPAERERRLDLAAQFAALFAAALAPGESDESDELDALEEPEYLLFGRLGAMIAQAAPEEARPIWEPLLALGTPAENRLAPFLTEQWRTALELDPVPATFALVIKEQLAFAAACTTWRGWKTDDLLLELVCLNRWGHPRMDDHHRALLTALQPEWSAVVADQIQNSYSARAIIPFLGEPVASDLLATALHWLAERERSAAPADEDVDQALADLLAALLGRDRRLLRHHPDAGVVLAALVARQNPSALELSAGLGRA